MPKTVGRLPAYATASFRADAAGHPKREHDQVKADSAAQKAVDMAPAKATDSTAQCRVCGVRVYEMEKLIADNYAYHKKCFKCCKCARILRVGNYASMDAQIFCKPHFVECFKQNGNYEEGFGKEKLSNRASTPEIKPSAEKENVPAADERHAHVDQICVESAVTATAASAVAPSVAAAGPATVAVDQDSQSVSSLNPTEFSLALEEKKRKLLQAAQASTEKSKDRLQKPVPGKLRPPPDVVSPGQQSPTTGGDRDGPAARPRTGAVLQIAAAIATAGDQLAHSETEPSDGSAAKAVADAQGAVRQRLLDPSARRDPRPISWCGELTSTEGDSSSGNEKKTHAVAAAATIVPGSLKMKLLDLEAAKEASRAAAAVQRQQRMEAEARAAAEAASAALAADAAAAAQGDGISPPEPTSAPLHFAEVASVKSRFESGETSSTSERTQTAAREEVEQVRSAVGQRAAAIRSRFQKKTASKGGLSAARSLPDLSPAGTVADGDEADDIGYSLGDEALDIPTAPAAKNEETVPKPGQLKSILSKLQSIQDSAENREKVRPRPLLVTDVDRHHSDNGNGADGMNSESTETLPPDAKFQEQPWPKKAKSLREKFECKDEQPSDGQALQSPKRPKPINILAEIEAYEQHNKAMGMKIKYVVESKGAENAADA